MSSGRRKPANKHCAWLRICKSGGKSSTSASAWRRNFRSSRRRSKNKNAKLSRIWPASEWSARNLTGKRPAIRLDSKMEADVTNEPVVRLTENAAAEVKSLLSKPENAGKTLRIYVEQ